MSQLCDSFKCTPLQALGELGYHLEAAPWPLLVEILEFRYYANARESLIAAERQDQHPDGEQYDMVRDIRARVQHAQLARMMGA